MNASITEYFECACRNKNHLVCIEYEEYNDSKEYGLTFYYQYRQWNGFWKRIWTAIKYIFNKASLEWDCTLITYDDRQKLQHMLDLCLQADKAGKRQG